MRIIHRNAMILFGALSIFTGYFVVKTDNLGYWAAFGLSLYMTMAAFKNWKNP